MAGYFTEELIMFSNQVLKIQVVTIVFAVLILTIVCYAFIFIKQPESLRNTRDGVPFFSPPVINPETGESIQLKTLVKHYKGEL